MLTIIGNAIWAKLEPLITAQLTAIRADAKDEIAAWRADAMKMLSEALPEMAGGTVSITLDFGTTSDPTEVVAVVETTYAHPTSFLFVEYEENIGYKDSYVLHQTQ